MNRVIKFRGKSHTFKKWFYGDLHHQESTNKQYKWVYIGAAQVDPKTVGEFTGFKDIDGKEIYEGDLIQNDAHPDIVERVAMIDGFWSGVDVDGESDDLCWLLENAPYKVIGNVFDNPELLEGGK